MNELEEEELYKHKRSLEDEMHKHLLEVGKIFYKLGNIERSISLTYVDIESPYNGNINPMEIRIRYPYGRPKEKK
jgi:hypothetical protein